jgi:hypothetical protein
VRAERLSLVGAQVAIRIEPDGQLTVFAGTNTRPLAATPSVAAMAGRPGAQQPATPEAPDSSAQAGVDHLLGMLAWIDGLGAAGLDGYELDEIGVKNGNVTVDDKRTGKQWAFDKINLSLTRLRAGELAFNIGSDDPEHPWLLAAGVKPGSSGRRQISLDARKVPLGDLLLAGRLMEGQFEASVPLSLTLRAEIGRDGVPQRPNDRRGRRDRPDRQPGRPDRRRAGRIQP